MKKFKLIKATRNKGKIYEILKKIYQLENDRNWIQCHLYNYETTEPEYFVMLVKLADLTLKIEKLYDKLDNLKGDI